MTWKSVWLELARTLEFPKGSANRCYLLRLPLNEAGQVDAAALAAAPFLATVKRFWPSTPDLSGHIVGAGKGWAFSFPAANGEPLMRRQPFLGFAAGELPIVEPDGSFSLYAVREVSPLRAPPPDPRSPPDLRQRRSAALRTGW